MSNKEKSIENPQGHAPLAGVVLSAFPDWSDERIKERIREIESEKESLEYSLTRLENELFYRNNPECRKH